MDSTEWWKTISLTPYRQTSPNNLVPGKQYILAFNQLRRLVTFVENHDLYPQYNIFRNSYGDENIYDPAFHIYSVADIQTTQFMRNKKLPEDLGPEISKYLGGNYKKKRATHKKRETQKKRARKNRTGKNYTK